MTADWHFVNLYSLNSTCCFKIIVLNVRQIITNYASNCMKKPQNDSLYKVGMTDSTNFKKAKKLPKVKNILHRTSLLRP